ncbi:MAG: histidinol-phosphate transaminase [Oscillospiraceae bacterium]|jgi:histidinol-phosphate aminotransferase|nr:histidinol-phosphate transaminase [Oscillospiraceae bacterium]
MKIEELTKPGIRTIQAYIPGDAAESVRPGVTEILKLASNENQLGTSPKALAAMQEAIGKSNIYPDAFGEELRKKIGIKFGFGDDQPENHVIVSAGASAGTSLLCDVFINPGDEILYCDPTFSAAASAGKRHGSISVPVPLTPDLKFDLKALRAAVTDKTKILNICNPNNPTGTVVDPQELREFIHSIPEHVIILVDEAYIEFSDDPVGNSMLSEIAEGVNVIIMRTFSKLYGLAGVRVGYMITNKEIQGILQKSSGVFAVSRVALAAATAALEDDEFVAKTKKSVSAGREYLAKEFTRLGCKVYNSSTNFIYIDTGYNTAKLAEACKERGLIIRGNYEFSRITVGTEYQNRRIVEIVEEVLASGEVPRVK